MLLNAARKKVPNSQTECVNLGFWFRASVERQYKYLGCVGWLIKKRNLKHNGWIQKSCCYTVYQSKMMYV